MAAHNSNSDQQDNVVHVAQAPGGTDQVGETQPGGGSGENVDLVNQIEPQEALAFYRTLSNQARDGSASDVISFQSDEIPSPDHTLTQPDGNAKEKSMQLAGLTIITYGGNEIVQLDRDDRVNAIKTDRMHLQDVDYDDGRIESFKLDGSKYELRDGTFQYKKDGKWIDTGWTNVVAAADGSLLLKHEGGNLEIRRRNGSVVTLPGANAEMDGDNNLTIERADGTKEVMKNDRSIHQFDAQGNLSEITYVNGDRRTFRHENGELTGFRDIDGKAYHLVDGKWLDQNGRETGMTNVFAARDGSFGMRKADGNIEVTTPSGKVNRLTDTDLGENATLYPDSNQRAQENARIERLIRDMGGLTDAGKKIIADATGLGIDSTDLFHGSHVVVEGDGGEMYRRWRDQAKDKMARDSSHESSSTEYQIKVGPGDAVILIGTTASGDTWFQLERSPASPEVKRDPLGFAWNTTKQIAKNVSHGDLNANDAHARDNALYKKIRQNVGPFGVSPHSDRNVIHARWTS